MHFINYTISPKSKEEMTEKQKTSHQTVKDIFLATAAWQSPQAVVIAWKLPQGLSLNSVVDELYIASFLSSLLH